MSEVDSYLRLKLSQELFHKPPTMLEPVERQRVDSVAARQLSIEQRILSSAEAAQVVLPASSLSQALAEFSDGRKKAEPKVEAQPTPEVRVEYRPRRQRLPKQRVVFNHCDFIHLYTSDLA